MERATETYDDKLKRWMAEAKADLERDAQAALAELAAFSIYGTKPQRLENRRGPQRAQPPRAHDFSNPYLVAIRPLKSDRLCVACGLIGASDEACTPRPGWREERERRIALFTNQMSTTVVLRDAKPAPPPWRPSIGEYDLLPDSCR